MPYLGFAREDYEAFKANDREGPVHMLNLVRLRAQAEYEDGSVASGREAYASYGRLSAPVFARVGGRIVWRGSLEQVVIGPQDEQWDLCFIAEYPQPGAFLEMLKDAEYRAAMVHRQAAVADSRLIRMAPLTAGGGFGDVSANEG
ncbi:DUF1330 domain-containing protein [Sedimentitalea sp. XS_ASV28]|uniref:DUF1330 domain-containing protein n=1 Tax=Sedimentitalea sp. XS_ASV28 TaxID=3241296 RepID=UPI003511422F